MATVMHPHSHHTLIPQSVVQKVCILVSVFNILIGLVGLSSPGFLKMHLSFFHNVVHLIVGVLALGAAYAHDAKHANSFCIGFGIFFSLLGIAGFIIGTPGYPGVGYMEADQSLFRIIPNILEFGTIDHLVHLILGALLLMGAYVWRKNQRNGDRAIVEYQSGGSNAQLRDAELGKSDVDRVSDQRRRRDFEDKL